MNIKRLCIIIMSIIGIGIVTSTALFFSYKRDTILEFQIRDSVSGSWVWDASVSLQDKIIKTYYQKDSGLKTYRFTGLKPGKSLLKISAPYYQTKEVFVVLKRGINVIEGPIEAAGLEIPGLDNFIIFESIEGGEITGELRPVTRNGETINNHPCLDIAVFSVVSEQMKAGIYIQKPEEKGSYRGKILFQGILSWTWHRSISAPFRYVSHLPLPEIDETNAPFWVIDYLILVPGPAGISPEEYKKLLQELAAVKGQEDMVFVLDRYKRSLKYFFSTSWNVPGGRR